MRIAVVALSIVVLLAACREERRGFRDPPTTSGPGLVRESELHPGGATPAKSAPNPYEGKAPAVAEGKRLFGWFNCNGCHFAGGGGIGPALMDPKWIYGAEPAQIFASIAEGRPNGMPAFRERLDDGQIWKLVAYIRTLGGTPPEGKAVDRPKQPAPSDQATKGVDPGPDA